MPYGYGKWINFSNNVTECRYDHVEIEEDEEEQEEDPALKYNDEFFDKLENEVPPPPKPEGQEDEET